MIGTLSNMFDTFQSAFWYQQVISGDRQDYPGQSNPVKVKQLSFVHERRKWSDRKTKSWKLHLFSHFSQLRRIQIAHESAIKLHLMWFMSRSVHSFFQAYIETVVEMRDEDRLSKVLPLIVVH